MYHVSLPSHFSHPLFLLISARYVHETASFQKHAVQKRKKKILTLEETQIINDWYTFSPQRPTNGLNMFFVDFFLNEDIKNIQNATVQNFQKTSISVPDHSPKRRTPTRHSIVWSPSCDSRHGDETVINSVNARREAKMSSGSSLHGEQGEP